MPHDRSKQEILGSIARCETSKCGVAMPKHFFERNERHAVFSIVVKPWLREPTKRTAIHSPADAAGPTSTNGAQK